MTIVMNVDAKLMTTISATLNALKGGAGTGQGRNRMNVVRCKDCKYNVANMEKDPLDITDYTDIVCSYFMTDGMDPNDFCSKGEPNESINLDRIG